MAKIMKIEITIAVILTIVAISVWAAYFNNQNNSIDSNVEIEQSSEVNNTFNFTFESDTVSVGMNESIQLPILTSGISNSVTGAELILKYDPSVIQINKLEKGTAFDLYLGDEIDSNLGIAKISGAFSNEREVSDEVFTTLELTRINEGITEIDILGSEDDSTQKSKVSLTNNTEEEVSGGVITIN